ncbi:winged helix-turn-helix transcriptional regulator [Cryobacterium luteum]|uniref:Transcriptional regulator n=1 Tax=Cryobacterium luteum TaxID=1424661 RepID=A0A1H8DIU2_9MICO|nr:helix-turn-helix domain-containing protein [Cryobacterium luteum]TFB82492.1 transcriptional regulator [Cryobacterium luteum]SEN06457.1 transcriptional regulator, HxlR family [Cryobacterium luteum]
MAARRSYGSYNDGCASAHALDLIGERWAFIVVRELLLGPKRFLDLQRDIPGIGPAVLTHRLQDLEETGIVMRTSLPAPARVMVYGLSEWGRGLEAVNTALSIWAAQSPRLPFEADMGPDTLVLAMRAHARRLPEGGPESSVALKLSDSRDSEREPVEYLATMTTTGSTVTKTTVVGAVDAVVNSTTRAWKAVIIGGASLESEDDIAITGHQHAVQMLVDATKL